MAYPGIYRAKALRLDDTHLLTANIPQVFGEAPVTITQFVGNPPAESEMGWVSFHGGRPEYPVWLGVGTGGGTVSDVVWVGADAPEDDDIELWWDTDESAPLDPRYIDVTGDTMAGPLTLPAAAPTDALYAANKNYVDTQDGVNYAAGVSYTDSKVTVATVVSSGFVVGASWQLDSQIGYRIGNIVTFSLTLTRLTSAVTITASGDIGNQTLATAPASMRGDIAAGLSCSSNGIGRVIGASYQPSTGVITLTALGGTTNFAVSEQLSVGGTFIVGTT